jgi:protein TonB
MKIYQLNIALCLATITCFNLIANKCVAQEIGIEEPVAQKLSKKEMETTVFTSVEKLPNFPGGMEKLFEFIKLNVHTPTVENTETGYPRVNVTFIVERNGKLSDVKAIGRFTKEYGAEAVRVMKISPAWIPGKQNGKTVRVQYTVPILFQQQ